MSGSERFCPMAFSPELKVIQRTRVGSLAARALGEPSERRGSSRRMIASARGPFPSAWRSCSHLLSSGCWQGSLLPVLPQCSSSGKKPEICSPSASGTRSSSCLACPAGALFRRLDWKLYLRPVPAHSRFYFVSAPLFFSGGVHVAEDHLSWGRRFAARPLALPVGFPLGAGEPPHAFLRLPTPGNPPTGTLFIWRSWAARKSGPGDLSLQARDSDHRAERFVVLYQSGGGRWAVRQFLGRVFPAFIAGVTPVRQNLVLVPLPDASFLSRDSTPWTGPDGEP